MPRCVCQDNVSDLSNDNFYVRLEKIAGLFLQLLQMSKHFDVSLNKIDLVCEIAKFLNQEQDLFAISYDSKKHCTETNPTDLIRSASDEAVNLGRMNSIKEKYTDQISKKEKRQKYKSNNKEKQQKQNPCFSKEPISTRKDSPNRLGQKLRHTKKEPQVSEENHEVRDLETLKQPNNKRRKKKISLETFQCSSCNKNFQGKLRLSSHRCTKKQKNSTSSSSSRSSGLLERKDICQSHHLSNEKCQVTLENYATCEVQDSEPEEDEDLEEKSFYTHSTRSTSKHSSRQQDPSQHSESDKFTCKICRKTVNSKAAFASHMRCHMTKDEFCCEFCRKEFGDPEELKAHRREHEGEERPYICEVCGKRFKTQGSIRTHMNSHTGRLPYKCDICGKAYAQTCGLNTHKLKHTAEEERTCDTLSADMKEQYKCHICGRTYKTKPGLSSHMNSHNTKQDCNCDFCEKKFFSFHDLLVHRRSHTKDKYTCHTCGASFKSRSPYYFHTRTHPASRPHLCSVCGKSFTRIYDLKSHKRKHTEDTQSKETEQHVCSVCGKVYQAKYSLTMHMKSHLGIFDHPCDFCDKKFKSHAELRHHRRTHTREKPYTCETCGQSFSRQSTLVNHRRIHSGERPYLCIVCGSAFKLSCTLKKHQRVHTRQNQGKGKGRTKKSTAAVKVPKSVPAISKAKIPSNPSPLPMVQLPSIPPLDITEQPTHFLQQPLILTTQKIPQELPPLAQSEDTEAMMMTQPSSSSMPRLQQPIILAQKVTPDLSPLPHSDLPFVVSNHPHSALRASSLHVPNLLELTNAPPSIAISTNMLHLRDPADSELFPLRETLGAMTTIRTFMAANDLDLRQSVPPLEDGDLELRDNSVRDLNETRLESPSESIEFPNSGNGPFQTYYYY